MVSHVYELYTTRQNVRPRAVFFTSTISIIMYSYHSKVQDYLGKIYLLLQTCQVRSTNWLTSTNVLQVDLVRVVTRNMEDLQDVGIPWWNQHLLYPDYHNVHSSSPVILISSSRVIHVMFRDHVEIQSSNIFKQYIIGASNYHRFCLMFDFYVYLYTLCILTQLFLKYSIVNLLASR